MAGRWWLPWIVLSSSSSFLLSTVTAWTTAYVLRHGQTDANAAGVIQGSSDISKLTSTGREQAEQLATSTALEGVSIDAVYLSPLRRAKETWDILRRTHQKQDVQKCAFVKEVLTLQLPLAEAPTVLPNLREIDFYDWEGKDKYELEASEPVSWRAWKEGNPSQLRVYDSETETMRYPLEELWHRAGSVWDEIWSEAKKEEEDDAALMIVAHGSLGQALLGTAMGWDATHFRRHQFPNTGLVEIEWRSTDQERRNKPVAQLFRPAASRWRWRWPVDHPGRNLEWNFYQNDDDETV